MAAQKYNLFLNCREINYSDFCKVKQISSILIVGQGLAGTALSWALRARGVSVYVTDDFNTEAWHRSAPQTGPVPSSNIAAGIVNPITGKRYAQSWRFDDFFPIARQFYAEAESFFNIKIWYDLPILRLLPDTEAENDWAMRCAKPGFSSYMEGGAGAGTWSDLLLPGFRFGQIKQAARVDFLPFLQAYRRHAREAGFFLPEAGRRSPEWLLQDHDYVIYCEGAGGASNPLFADLNWQVSKGEALLIRLATTLAAPLSMLKQKIMAVPLSESLLWCGATSEWHFDHALPSEQGRQFIEEGLDEMLSVPYEVVGHYAAVRPTVKDRRPLLGCLPSQPRIGIFNGLGTKGGLLAPYWALQMVDYLLDGKAMDPEVDIQRCHR